VPTEQELEILSRKLNQLKLAYEQYFLGSRPREPQQLRDEVQKAVIVYSNEAIQNTALRFKFSSINSRYQAFKRQWGETLRRIEDGTYERHRFKAKLRERAAAPLERSRPAATSKDRSDIYGAYLEARRSCGEPVDDLSRQKLDAVLDKQEAALRQRYGDREVEFRVVVENGRAKLKARCATAGGS